MSKKLISATLTATTSVWLSGAMLLMPVAQAQSVEALQAQISSLLAQITALQAQLGASTGGSMSYTFTRDLTVGSTGDDVKALQQFLNSHGAQVAASGAGSPGSESTYFGALTKAAVAKWQAAQNISPTAGYFGPKTRAAVNSMMATAPSPAPGTPGPVPPPASGLAVSLAADSATGSAIAGAGQVKAGKFAFTASASGAVTLTGLEFSKVGVLSDSNISNLYLADALTGEIVAQYQSLTGGLATFSGLNLSVGAGQTWWGELRMDVSTSAGAGNTIAWKLSKVTTASGAPVSGSPTTNALTVTTVSNPSIATMTLTATAVGSSVDAGTSNVLVSAWTANVTNSKVNLQNMQFTFVGSANPADIRNLILKVNGVQVATLAQASTNVNFNFASSPVTLNTGNSNIELFADVMGSPNRTMTYSLLQPYRVSAVDSQYNTGISPTITSTSQTTITINQGSISVSLSSNTPTGNVPIGASNVTLVKFRIYAAGEAVKVKFLDATITKTGGGSWATAPTSTTNIKLIDDAGGQVGNSVATVASGTSSGQCTLAATSIVCHFGTSSSPINYIVPANTAREISLVLDIGSSADATTLQGSLPGNTDNMEGQTSFVTTLDSGSATGSTLTVVTTPLAVVANTGFSAPTYVAGANGVKMASFVISASSADGARISSLTFDKDLFALDMQNMKVMVGSTQFGTTRATLSATAAETSIAFSGTAIVVPSGGSVTVDVYADILTGSATQASVFDLTGWSAIGVASLSTISFGSEVVGQSITISSGPTLTVAQASESAPTKQVVMGSTGNSLFTLRLTADNVEDVRVTDITLADSIGSGATGIASYENLTLYDGTTVVAGPLGMTMPGSATSSVSFSLQGGGVIVLKNGTKNLELKGNVATFSSGGATSGSTHNWGLLNSTSSVTAYGKDSSASATVSGSPTSNTSTVYRTKVTLSSSLLGSSSGRARTAVDDLATLNFAANSSYQAVLGTVSLKFSGIAVTNGTASFTVDLIDTNTNVNIGSAAQQTCIPGVGNSCTVTFAPQFTIDSGTTKATKIRINSASLFDASVAGSQSLSVLVNGTDQSSTVMIYDGSTQAIPLEATVVPFTVVNVSYE